MNEAAILQQPVATDRDVLDMSGVCAERYTLGPHPRCGQGGVAEVEDLDVRAESWRQASGHVIKTQSACSLLCRHAERVGGGPSRYFACDTPLDQRCGSCGSPEVV